MDFGHVLTAVVTPFNREGEIDFDKLSDLLEHLIATSTEGVVIAGTTGESVTLSYNEIERLLVHAVSIVNGRIPVIAGTGTNNTQSSIYLTKKAEQIGVDGIMLVAPYYNRPNQAGLYEHFKCIANATTLPIMLYNIPGRSTVNIDFETVVALSKITNIVSIKEASTDLDQITRIIDLTEGDFKVYSGNDGMTLPILSIGGEGVVSVASHIIGNEISEMVYAFKLGLTEKAAKLHRELLPLMNGLFIAPSPAPIKTALKMKGIDVGTVRLPLVPLSRDEEVVLKKLIMD